jgi:HEAT repeats
VIARIALHSVLAVAAAVTSAAAQGRISNARIEARPFGGSLEREVQSAGARGATWIGYRTPMIPGQRHICCSDSIRGAGDCCGTCRLESGGGVTLSQSNGSDARSSRVVLEPPSDLVILARVENGAVTRLRTFSPDCDIDGDGMPIVWLENVPAAASVAWLTTLVKLTGDREQAGRVIRPALGALALHPDRSALTTLIALARQDSRREVRNQALFWLSQRAGQEAVTAITDALQNDPETEVKRRAVFALSQLPKDEGIPLLIQVARTNQNLEVRKQAMFWLGQSHDPRAVTFFEEVLRAR